MTVRACVYLYIYIYMCVYLCVCVCVYVCVFVFVCVCQCVCRCWQGVSIVKNMPGLPVGICFILFIKSSPHPLTSGSSHFIIIQI